MDAADPGRRSTTARVLDGPIGQLTGRVRQWLGPAPRYGPDSADLRTFSVGGLELPVRATVAVLLVVVAICLDWSRTFIPQGILDLGRAAPAMRYQATERLILFGALPLLVVVAGFRDRPARYGLALGAWRIGLPVALAGIAVMSPIILALAARPEFAAYYAPSHASLGDVLVTSLLDLPASEFLIRGFLMFALLRLVGPVAVVLATLPFVFSHLGKPEIELLSTFFGGLAYGWLDWRTGSIWWSAATHVVLVTLLVSAVSPG